VGRTLLSAAFEVDFGLGILVLFDYSGFELV